MLPTKKTHLVPVRGQLAVEGGKTGFMIHRWEAVSELTLFFLILQVKKIKKKITAVWRYNSHHIIHPLKCTFQWF